MTKLDLKRGHYLGKGQIILQRFSVISTHIHCPPVLQRLASDARPCQPWNPENVSVLRTGVYFHIFELFRAIQGFFIVFYVVYVIFNNEIPPLQCFHLATGSNTNPRGLFVLDPKQTKCGTGGRDTEFFAISGPFSNRVLPWVSNPQHRWFSCFCHRYVCLLAIPFIFVESSGVFV